jgi:hypothetical protein
MGLQGSPVSFARLVDFVMTGVKGIITYIDDILVHLRDHEQHLKTDRRGTLEATQVRPQAQRGQDDHRSEDGAVLRLHTV